ncbi:hypothetical protein L1887_05826 [Cichorium endivia]|nr:hypothetical protein L1887_05826 [Cichorium endivia]
MKLEGCAFSDLKELAAGVGPKIVCLCSFSQEVKIGDTLEAMGKENLSMEWHKGVFLNLMGISSSEHSSIKRMVLLTGYRRMMAFLRINCLNGPNSPALLSFIQFERICSG